MKNIGKLWTQIAAEAGCTANKAKVAVYLRGLSEDGKTLDEAASLMRRKPDYIRRYAREFLIDFADYRPFARAEKAGKPRPAARITLDLAA
jgi:hypothetical protein